MADQNTLPDWRQLPVVGSAPAASPAVPPSVLGGASAPADWRSLPVVGQVGGAAPAPAPEAAAEPDWKKLPVVGQTTPGGVTPSDETKQPDQGDPNAPWYSKAWSKSWNWVNAPLIDDQFLKDNLGIDASDTRGWSRGLIDLAEGMTSPLSLALIIGSMGSLGELGAAGRVALKGAGLSEQALSEVVKGSEVLTRAFNNGKLGESAWAEVAKAGFNRGVIEDGLAKLDSMGLDRRALFERNVVHRITSNMLHSSGLSFADAEKYARGAATLVDAGFTYDNAASALITMPRVLDALKDGDYDHAKQYAIEGLATSGLAILGIGQLGREAGGLMEEAKVRLGLGERMSDSLHAGAKIFGTKTAEIVRAGQEIKDWTEATNQAFKDLGPLDRERVMKLIEAEGEPKTLEQRLNYLVRATGKTPTELAEMGVLPKAEEEPGAVYAKRSDFSFPSFAQLAERHGTTDDITKAAFVLPDGRMIRAPEGQWTHDEMLGYKPADNAREDFINETGAARVRFVPNSRAGRELHVSLPVEGPNGKVAEAIRRAAEVPLSQMVVESADPLNGFSKRLEADRLENGGVGIRRAEIERALKGFDKSDVGWAGSVLQDIEARNGTTWNPRMGRVSKGFAFDIFPEATEVFDHPITARDLTSFYEQHKGLFDASPQLNVGVFRSHPEGEPDAWQYELGVSAVTRSKQVALEIARRLNQQYIVDLSKIPADGVPSTEALEKALGETGIGVADRTRANEMVKRENPDFRQYGWGQRLQDLGQKQLLPQELTDIEKRQLAAGRDRDQKFFNLIKDAPELKELVAAIKVGMVGAKWYERSFEAFAAMREAAPSYFFPEDADRFAGVVAALSNRREPLLNLRDALGFWRNWVDAGRPVDERQVSEIFRRSGLPDMPSKMPNLLTALKSEELLPATRNEYFKVGNFAADLRGVLEHVALDQWMGIFFGLKDNPSTVPVYHALAVLVRQAAREMDMKPADAQAAIWAFTRTLGEISGWSNPKGGRYYRPTSMLPELTPERIAEYSEDFADIMRSDREVREKLHVLGVNLNELDQRLERITPKPPSGAGEPSLAVLRPAARRIGKAQQRLERFKQAGGYTQWVRSAATDFSYGANDLGGGSGLREGEPGLVRALRVPGFYSQAEVVAQEKLPTAATGDQILATLRNSGVKQQEIDELGLSDLKGKGRVSREDVLKQIDLATSNLVQENQGGGNYRSWTLQGGTNYREHLYKFADRRAAEINQRLDQIQEEIKQAAAEAERKSDANYKAIAELRINERGRISYEPHSQVLSVYDEHGNLTKHSALSTRELPRVIGPILAEALLRTEITRGYHVLEGDALRSVDAWSEAASRTAGLSDERLRLRDELNEIGEYKGGHFNGNTFGHMRTTDRTDTGGNKVLMIEEEQSDIHQKARDRMNHAREQLAKGSTSQLDRLDYEQIVANRGYEPRIDRVTINQQIAEIDHRLTEIDARIAQVKNEQGGGFSVREDYVGRGANRRTRYVLMQGETPIAAYNSRSEAQEQVRNATMSPEEIRLTEERKYLEARSSELAIQRDRSRASTLPPMSAPFKGSSYWEFMFKRALRLAAEEGKNKLAWTTGDQQIERYSAGLRKEVDRLEYNPETKSLLATKNGRTVRDLRGVESHQVADYVGKSIAEKLLNGQVVSGDNITIDSPGMRVFYDKMMVEFANKYLKKWGARVGESHIAVGGTTRYVGPDASKPALRAIADGRTNARFVAQDMFDRLERGLTPKKAWELTIAEQEGQEGPVQLLAEMLGGKILLDSGYETTHSVDITPELRKSLMTTGQALYRRVLDPQTANVMRQMSVEDLQKKYGPFYEAAQRTANELGANVGARYVPRQGMTPGYIELNKYAYSLLDAIFHSPNDPGRGKWLGLTIQPNQFDIINQGLKKAQQNMAQFNAKAGEAIGVLAGQFQQAAKEGQRSGVAVALEGQTPDVINEERFHGVQTEMGEGRIFRHLPDHSYIDLALTPEMQEQFGPRLVNGAGYEPHPKLLVIEAAAHIGVGDEGIGGTLDQRASFFTKYLKAVAEYHGVDSIDAFKPTLAEDMGALLQGVQEHLREQEKVNASIQRLGRTRFGKVQSELFPPNEGIPAGEAAGRAGAGAGGEGGAGEDRGGAAGPASVKALRAENPEDADRRMTEERIEEIIKRTPLAKYTTTPAGRDYLKHLFETYNSTGISDQHNRLAKHVQDYFSQSLERAQKTGVLNEGVENYVTHMWKPGEEKDNEALNRTLFEARNGSFNLNTNMARKRLFMTGFEGELLGKQLAHADPVALAAHNRNSFERVIANRSAYAQLRASGLKASDGRPVVALSGHGTVLDEDGSNPAIVINPDHAHSIRIADKVVQDLKAKGDLDRLVKRGDIVKYGKEGDENYAWRPHDYKTIDHSAMRDWVFAVSAKDGTPVFVRGDLRIHPEWADYVKKQLGADTSPIRESWAGKKVLTAGREAKGFLLAFSPFHIVQEGLRAVMTGVNPFGMEKPDLHDEKLFNGVVHGLTLGKDYRGVEEFESEGLVGHSKWVEGLPVIGQLQQKLETFLFDQYVPSLKARAYRRLVDSYRQANPEWTDEKVYETAAADTNERFGGINYKRIGRSAATQDILRIVALAPDWLESEVRFMARVFGREGTVARRDVATMAVLMWGAARVLNYLTTGQPHMEAPFGVAVKDDEGKEKIYSIRTMPTDILHAVQDPVEFLKGRTAPLAKAGIQAYTGRDQWGKKLPGYSMLWDLAQSAAPIPLQSVTKAMATANQTTTPDQMWKAAGAMVRPYQTEAQKLATTIASDHSEEGVVDPSVLRRHQAVMHFEDEIRAQRMPMQAIYQMVHAGQLPEGEAKKIEKNIKETEGMAPEVARFYTQAKRAPMREFLRIWDAGTTNEKAMLAQLLLAKRKRYFTKARTDMTPNERLADPTYRRLMEMFPNQPPW